MKHRDAELQGFHVNGRGEARGTMRMQLERDSARVAHHRGDQRADAIDGQQPALILEVDDVRLEGDQRLGLFDVTFVGMPRGDAQPKRARDLQAKPFQKRELGWIAPRDLVRRVGSQLGAVDCADLGLQCPEQFS